MCANIENILKGIAHGKERKMRKKKNVTFGRLTGYGRLKTNTLILGENILYMVQNLRDRTI